MRKQAVNLTVNLGFAHGIKLKLSLTCHNSTRVRVPPGTLNRCPALKPHSQGTFVHPANTVVISLVLKGDKLTSGISFIEVTRDS